MAFDVVPFGLTEAIAAAAAEANPPREEKRSRSCSREEKS